ncbi:MAG: hypothetical protein RLZZ200_2825 [Pseudomonadota bacterium]
MMQICHALGGRWADPAYGTGMDETTNAYPEGLNPYESAWIAGWLAAKGIGQPTFEQFRDALFAMIETRSGYPPALN